MYEDGGKLSYEYTANTVFTANTTLFALWESTTATTLPAPNVSVEAGAVKWDAIAGAGAYYLTVIGPDGETVLEKNTLSTIENVAFSSYDAGDYEITVVANPGSANSSTAVRYYKNKALNRVSQFSVIEPSVLIYDEVAGAEKYLITVVCGNEDHNHTEFDNGTSRSFNFANCEMKKGGIEFIVTAVANGYASSVSERFVYNRELAEVGELSYDAEKAEVTWDAVANAVSYTVSLYEVVDGTYTLLTTANAAQNQCDFTALIEDGKYYAFDVCALGDGVYFLDSDISDFSEVYRKGNTIEQILAVLIALRNSKYAITAEAGEGGVISGEGVTKVKYGNDITYHIAAMPGYEIDRVIVDGKDVGAVSEYTFENVKKKHTITVTFKEVVWVNPFTDVSEADPFFDAVRFVYDCKLFNGISETEFAPEMSMTRAMFVTVLWRLEGMPVVNYLMQYDDVADETWYTEAIRWATAEGIVEGYGDGIFGTEDAVTVQQATVIMARYAQYAGTYTAPTANMDIFADNAEVADWAVEAMAWAVENGIYVPENGKLNPTAMAPRSLAAQFMHAYVVKFSK
jgi:hypothetical protein